MHITEYQNLDAVDLARLVRDDEVEPSEVLRCALEKIEEQNSAVNAVVARVHDEAQSLAKSIRRGPLAGVPFLLKDLDADYAGLPTSRGSAFFVDDVAEIDSEIVRRYKESGLLIIGKTNTPEFGLSPTTEPALFGPTHNPWNLRFSSGGSSGGSAAAVATGMVPAAHGTDGGGSLRIPASFCGVFGFKPTRGLTPSGPQYGELWGGKGIHHVITRTVRDCAALLDVTCGYTPGDPYLAPYPEAALSRFVTKPPKALKVAVQRSTPSGSPVDRECLEAVDQAAELMEELGHHLIEGSPSYDHDGMGAASWLVAIANVEAAVDERVRAIGREPTEREIEPGTARMLKEAKRASAAELAQSLWVLHRGGRSIAPFFRKYDVLLSPVTARTAPPLGEINAIDQLDQHRKAVADLMAFTSLANNVGHPAMAVPFSGDAEGVPLGVQIMGDFGQDSQLLRLANQLEEARPWPRLFASI